MEKKDPFLILVCRRKTQPPKAKERTVGLNKTGRKPDAKMQALLTSERGWDTFREKPEHKASVVLPGRGMVYGYPGLGSDRKILQTEAKSMGDLALVFWMEPK